jgi:hypothetical protein
MKRRHGGVLASLLGSALLAVASGCGGGSCALGSGTAPLGAACGSDCDCVTTNCTKSHCLPRVAWTAMYQGDSPSADVVADTPNGLFVSGMFAGVMDVDPTDAVDTIKITSLPMPFATALTRDEAFVWGEALATTPTNPVDKNPAAVRVARPAGANVVLGLGDINSIKNAWRIDAATGQLQSPDVHLGASDFDVRPDTGDIIATDSQYVWAIDQAGQEIWRTYIPAGRVRVDPTGGYIVASAFDIPVDIDPGPAETLYTPVYQDVQVTKLAADGASWSWRTALGGQGTHWLDDVSGAADGTVYVAGHFDTTIVTAVGTITAGDQSDAFAAALNADGTVRWLTLLGGEDASNIVPLPDGNALVGGFGDLTVAGSPPAPAFGQGDLFLVELDRAGGLIWAAYSDLPSEMQLGRDGAVYIHGSINGSHLDATPFRGGYLDSSEGIPTYQSGIVAKMMIR